jgi:hypothetical protein
MEQIFSVIRSSIVAKNLVICVCENFCDYFITTKSYRSYGSGSAILVIDTVLVSHFL